MTEQANGLIPEKSGKILEQEKLIGTTKRKRIGRPPKIVEKYRISLVKEYTNPITLSEDEKQELDRIFRDYEERIIGEEIYKLRLLKWSKSKIMQVIGLPDYKFEKLLGVIELSQFLQLRIQEVAANPDILNVDYKNIDFFKMDKLSFKDINTNLLKQKLGEILSQINDVKIMDASLDEITAAYKRLFDAYRLETGQTTQNSATFSFNINNSKENFDDKELKKIEKEIKELKKVLETQK